MKKKIIIAVIAVIVIAAGVFAGLYFGTDIFKKDEEQTKQEQSSKLANKLDEYLQNSEVLTSTKLESFSKKLQNSSYRNEGSMLMKVSNISELSELNNVKLSFDGKVDPKSKNFEQNLAVNYGGLSIDANLVKNKDVFGVQSDLLTGDKYVAIKNSNLKDLFAKLGLDEDQLSQIPDKIDLSTLENTNEYLPSDEELTNILNKYLGIIEKGIDGLDSKTSGSTKTIEAKEKDVYEIVVKILEEAKNDKDLLNMIVDYSNQYAEISGENVSITVSDLKEAIDEAIEEVKSTETDEGNKLIIVLTYNSKKIVEKAKITVYSKGEETVTMEFISTDDMIKFAFTDGSDEIAITLEKDESDDSVEYEFTVSAKISGISATFAKIKVSFDDLDSNTVTQTLDMSFSIPTGYKTASISLNMTNKIKFEDVNVRTLSASNAEILNDLSKEELQKLILEIYTRMGMSY